MSSRAVIRAFELSPGTRLGDRYVVQSFLGSGWEGEVYRVVETRTGIARAAKLFFPQRNRYDASVKRYARKLDKLKGCHVIVQYHHSETFVLGGVRVTGLISELVEGMLFHRFVRQQPGGRLQPYEALCLLHALTAGVEQIHAAGEYHGDLHSGNVLIKRLGIRFAVRMLDFFPRGRAIRAAQRDDVVDLVHLLYHAVGGQERYRAQPGYVRDICKGLRRDLITKRFPSAARLRQHLETFAWNE